MILLQAAIGFGFLLQFLAKILIFVGIPFVTILLISKRGNGKLGLRKQSAKEIFETILVNLLYAILIILAFAVVIFFFLYLTVDLSDS